MSWSGSDERMGWSGQRAEHGDPQDQDRDDQHGQHGAPRDWDDPRGQQGAQQDRNTPPGQHADPQGSNDPRAQHADPQNWNDPRAQHADPQNWNDPRGQHGTPQEWEDPRGRRGAPQGWNDPRGQHGAPQNWNDPRGQHGAPQDWEDPRGQRGAPQGWNDPRGQHADPQGWNDPRGQRAEPRGQGGQHAGQGDPRGWDARRHQGAERHDPAGRDDPRGQHPEPGDPQGRGAPRGQHAERGDARGWRDPRDQNGGRDPRDQHGGRADPRARDGSRGRRAERADYVGWGPGVPRYDPNATVMLPVIPADATVVLPAYRGGPDEPGDQDDDGRSVARNSAVMAVGSIVSRLTGLLRTAVLAAALGAVAVSNSYNLANTVPNQIYELLLGGVLDSSFIPLLVRARRRDPDRGEAYAQRLLTLAMVFLGTATVLAVAAAPLISLMFSNSKTTPAGLHLTTVFGYLLLPRIFFFGAAALIAAVLNTRGHFAAPMFTPILNNIVVIATGVLFILLPTVTHPPTPENISTPQILVLGLGTTLGMLVQTIGLLPALRKVGFRWKLRWDWGKLHLRELGRISSWMLVYVVVSQIALVLVLWISNRAGSQHVNGELAPGPTIFNNAYLIFMMANGIVAVSITVALLPRMSVAAAERRWNDLVRNLSLGTRLTSVILIPASVAMIVLGRQLGVTLFGWHDYAGRPAVETGWVIAAAGLCLVPFAISQLQLFAFYAMPDTKTPALLNIPVSGLRIAIDLILLVALPVVWVDAGLMVGNAISFVLSAVAGYWLLRRRIGSLNLGEVGTTLGKLAVAGVIAGVPTLLVSLILEHYLGLGRVGSIVALVAGGLVLVVVYLAVAVALRVRDVNQVFGMVRSKLGR